MQRYHRKKSIEKIIKKLSKNPLKGRVKYHKVQSYQLAELSIAMHTVAIWTFSFHQNSVEKSDDFVDLTLAH